MREEEFISYLSEESKSEEGVRRLRAGVPLGRDLGGNTVFSQKRERPFTVRHTCVTGLRRTAFIRRLIITLSCLYERDEANFLIVSPRAEYGELLRLRSADVTVPFIRVKSDLDKVMDCVRELVRMYQTEKGHPRLILVLDGLEELEGCNKNGDLEEYRAFFDLTLRNENVEIITGAELMKSIFSGYPGAFVGVGNCLVTTREEGKADVTYVGDVSSLSMPTAMSFPDSPSVTETIIFLNSLPASTNTYDDEE